jgi:glucokinase
MSRRSLGLDLGGTKLLACIVDEEGQVVAHTTRATGRATPPSRALGLFVECAEELRQEAGDFEAVGLGFPGVADRTGRVARSSIILDGWQDVRIAALIEEALGLPAVVDNDVNAALVAELAARGRSDDECVLMVAVGTGIGGALAFGGRVWRGASGAAGEIGNTSIDRHGAACWCGRRGCVNTVASGSAIAARLGDGERPLSARVAAGDREAIAVVAAAATALGEAIANAMQLVSPALVILGGGVVEIGQPFIDVVERTARALAFAENAESCVFERARLGYRAGAIGAALLGLAGRQRARAVQPATGLYRV